MSQPGSQEERLDAIKRITTRGEITWSHVDWLIAQAEALAAAHRRIETAEAESLVLSLKLSEASQIIEALERLVALHEEYLTFINKANEAPITLAFAHGWRCPDADMRQGAEYRDRIASLRAALTPAERTGE